MILVDNSGSMTGKRAGLARAIVESILDTLTDNDFVNAYKFSDTTEETLPCTKDMLVQVYFQSYIISGGSNETSFRPMLKILGG